MARTFGDVVRSVRGHCPLAPPLLVWDWVQNGANKIADRRQWSYLRSQGELYLQAAREGTATATQGSDVVTPGTLTFSAADVGRQLQFSAAGLPLTIIAYNAPNVQVDRAWVEATNTLGTAKVVDAYITMPEDFGSFIAILDPAREDIVAWWITEDELNFRDPGRREVGDPYWIVSRKLASEPAASLGRVQYEAWPYCSSARKFPYFYSKRPKEYADGDYFEGPFRHRADLLTLAGLVEACEWPGTGEQRNPYFNLGLAQRKRDELAAELNQLETRDEEIYMTWLETVSWIRVRGMVPTGSDWWRNHE